MIWALALLLCRTLDVPPAAPTSSQPATVAVSVTDETRGSAGETPSTADPEAKQKPPAASASTNNAANVPGSPSASSAGASPAPAGKTSLPAAGRASTPRLWYALVTAGHGAAMFDAWSTRRVIESGTGRERDPLMRPFARSGAIYAAIQVGPGLLDYLARRMLNSNKRWMRRLWWLPQAAGTAGSLWSGAHNLRLTHR